MNKKLFAGVSGLLLLTACTRSGNAPQPNPVPGQQWVVTTFAGDGNPFFANSSLLQSQFRTPEDITIASDGAWYIADALNHRIRKIDGLQVSTAAGFDREDTASGKGTAAGYAIPVHIASDHAGNVYTLDIHDFRIRKINPQSLVTVVAGTGIRGFLDGRADIAQFGECSGITVDTQRTIYVCDYDSRKIRMITTSGQVSTLAGSGTQGFVDGDKNTAQFFSPNAITCDRSGNIFVGDIYCIRKITPAGIVSTLTGSSNPGDEDGAPGTARFRLISGITIDNDGNLFLSDVDRIRKVTPQGIVSTIAGSTTGYLDGTGTNAQFNDPLGLTVNNAGNIYVADNNNHRIRKISKL